jgi:hypothetical protein
LAGAEAQQAAAGDHEHLGTVVSVGVGHDRLARRSAEVDGRRQ